jgi:adiponectin receptor
MLRNRVLITTGDPSTPAIPPPTKQSSSTIRDVLPPPGKSSKSILLSISQVPEWYGENPYIRSGYRPVFAAVAPCFRSWSYLHNQSFNIYTHLVPGVLALAANAALWQYFSTWYPDATALDRLVFHLYLTAVSVCFGVSAAYHTLLCHSRELADLWVRLDYVSISVLILGSFVPGLYMGFYCEMGLLGVYLGLVSFWILYPMFLLMLCSSSSHGVSG